LEDSRQKYEEEAVKSKSLEMQLSKVRSQQISTTVYEQVTVELQMTVQENQELKESMEDLRRGLVDMATDSSAKLQRMSNEFSNQLRKDQSKIEALEDSLGEKEEEVERLQKAMKNKEK
jgi:ribosome recycling factor